MLDITNYFANHPTHSVSELKDVLLKEAKRAHYKIDIVDLLSLYIAGSQQGTLCSLSLSLSLSLQM